MKRLLLPLGLAVTASPAFAHLDPGAHGSLMAGFSHPLFGLDHVLAMVAVGLWAGLQGGRARWALPVSFVAVMALGFGLSMLGVPLPFVESMILASVIVLGLLVAVAARVDMRVGAGLVGLLAVFHGHAHGTELGQAGALNYGLGFMAATIVLHVIGIALVLLAEKATPMMGGRGRRIVRTLGGVFTVVGAGLALG